MRKRNLSGEEGFGQKLGKVKYNNIQSPKNISLLKCPLSYQLQIQYSLDYKNHRNMPVITY